MCYYHSQYNIYIGIYIIVWLYKYLSGGFFLYRTELPLHHPPQMLWLAEEALLEFHQVVNSYNYLFFSCLSACVNYSFLLFLLQLFSPLRVWLFASFLASLFACFRPSLRLCFVLLSRICVCQWLLVSVFQCWPICSPRFVFVWFLLLDCFFDCCLFVCFIFFDQFIHLQELTITCFSTGPPPPGLPIGNIPSTMSMPTNANPILGNQRNEPGTPPSPGTKAFGTFPNPAIPGKPGSGLPAGPPSKFSRKAQGRFGMYLDLHQLRWW